MKKMSIEKFMETVHHLRKEKGLTQAQLAAATGINRAMIDRMESKDYVPSMEQMQALGGTLGFEVDMFVEDGATEENAPVIMLHTTPIAHTATLIIPRTNPAVLIPSLLPSFFADIDSTSPIRPQMPQHTIPSIPSTRDATALP